MIWLYCISHSLRYLWFLPLTIHSSSLYPGRLSAPRGHDVILEPLLTPAHAHFLELSSSFLPFPFFLKAEIPPPLGIFKAAVPTQFFSKVPLSLARVPPQGLTYHFPLVLSRLDTWGCQCSDGIWTARNCEIRCLLLLQGGKADTVLDAVATSEFPG